MGSPSPDHSRVPVLEALQKYRDRGDINFSPPGHRQGRSVDPRVLDIVGADVFATDILVMGGLDDRRQSQGVLQQAQDLMAAAVGAEEAFFSTCGSSLSVRTAMMSVAGPGEKLLVSRNAHKSVTAGLILSGIVPVWVRPHFDSKRHIAHPPEPEDVRAALAANPDAKGMLLITPTDWGTCADIRGVAEACHAADIPLIVDEAWGASFPFHPDLPTWGMNADADLVVTSVHKMGVAVEQSSVFHLQGNRVDPSVLAQRDDLMATTSATTLVYATLDGWRRQMVERGKELLGTAIDRAQEAREAIETIAGLHVMGDEIIGPQMAFERDPLRIVVEVEALGISGYQAVEFLRAACHVNVGAGDRFRLEADISIGDGPDEVQRLVDGLRRLADEHESLETPPDVPLPSAEGLELEQAMLPRDAFFGRTEAVKAEEAVGRIAAEMASPYPPGVPVYLPGEVISKDVVDYLRASVEAGALIPDAADSKLETIKVVADE